MSVIITGMDIPKSCTECRLTYIDTGDDAYFGSNEDRCVIDNSTIDIHSTEREYDCPLKSVEGLIERIEKAKHYRGSSGMSIIDAHDKGLDKYFDLGLERAIHIIKEYCEVEE